VEAGGQIVTVVARLTAHEQMTIAGDVHSDASNTFRYRSGGPVPIIVGSVSPAPVLTPAALTACTALAVCGNGTVEPPEECDHGAANGTSGDSCDATCREVTPALRIPGGGSKAIDCAAEWSARLAPGSVAVDGAGVPRNSQVCSDDDPACDADATVGTCAFSVWLCLGGNDPRIACPAATVSSVEVRGPTGLRGAPGRVALVGALQALDFPVGPAEQCSARAVIDVPARKSVKLKVRAALTTGKRDSDALKLKCVAP
jgi:cysteine-rich repeat protein